jgi:hypothetical protein
MKATISLIYYRKKRLNLTWGHIMSDRRRRYCAVKDKVCQLLPEQWARGKSGMLNLSLMVSAIVKAKGLTQHAIAAEMLLPAQDTGLAQRQRRWLMNEHVDVSASYEPIIQPFWQAMGVQRPFR